jgi:hypothetical protein
MEPEGGFSPAAPQIETRILYQMFYIIYPSVEISHGKWLTTSKTEFWKK